MDKNKGIWTAIGGILVVGILVTVMTANFVRKEKGMNEESFEMARIENQESSQEGISDAAFPEPLSSDFSAPAAALPKEESGERTKRPKEAGELKADPSSSLAAKTLDQPAPAAVEPEDLGEGSQETAAGTELAMEEESLLADESAQPPQAAIEEAQTQAELIITPLSPNMKNRSSVLKSTDAASYYQKHLEELDGQIKKLREETGDSSTYSMKALADKELKLWNRELNDIYAVISDNLSEEDKEKLETSQEKWIKERDAKAKEAGKKYSGGSLEGVEYTASMAGSARTRAYDLVSEYAGVLEQEEMP